MQTAVISHYSLGHMGANVTLICQQIALSPSIHQSSINHPSIHHPCMMCDLRSPDLSPLVLKLLAWYCPLLPFFPFVSNQLLPSSFSSASPPSSSSIICHFVHFVDSNHTRQLKGSPTSSRNPIILPTFQFCNENTAVFNRAFNSLCQHYSLATQHIVKFLDRHSAVYVFAPCQRLQTPSAAQAAIIPYTTETL